MKARSTMRGFTYHLEDEKIREFLALCPADRLRWLHAANQFLRLATPARNRRIWEALLRGDVDVDTVTGEASEPGES